MSEAESYQFEAQLLAPAQTGDAEPWLFLILPKDISDHLPRRGRTTVTASIKNHEFLSTLEPDGQLSHWLKLDADLCKQIKLKAGDQISLSIAPVDKEPEPAMPDDLRSALNATPGALAVWDSTTTIARLDWIHWIESAKQYKTRVKRIGDACNMLAEGKKRVCCFDQSGFYSKSLSAPKVSA